jgi:natural product precursor
MKKIERPKLKLQQETVRTLENTDLKVIIGGNNPPSNRTDCRACV